MATKVPPNPASPQAQAERLKILRIALGYSQEAMAEIIGLSTAQAWKNFEDGRPLHRDYAIRIHQRTGVDSMWLFHAREDNLPANMLAKIRAAERGDLKPPARGRRRKS